MAEINEWTFAADACSTIERILAENPDLPFSGAKVEQGTKRSRKRRDVTLFDRDGAPVLTGEIKLPDKPDGQSPYATALVEDAFDKANDRGVEYFFTWNVNRFVLWKTFEAKKPVFERDQEHIDVTSISETDQLSNVAVQRDVREFLAGFLRRFSKILEGSEPIPSRPLDEKFIRVLESALELPILQTNSAIDRLYRTDRRFSRDIDKWMRDSQGWTISDAGLRENLDRAAKLSCYVLANKLVFHQILRRKFSSLRKIRIPEKFDKAEQLRDLLGAAFDQAKRASHDYETVFDGDFGDILPLLDDKTVSSWREFVREIEGFDFSKIDYDVISLIFGRLIGADERHRYGQHYTRSEIVDLINAFAIRREDATVLDPACGGGTFLVRAYVLKRGMSQRRLTHERLLSQIRGFDISAFAAHLSTINLASRDLIDEQNYPLVARQDFFDVKLGEAIFHVPMSKHGGGKQMVPLNMGKVDCVVANPPYIRQESLSQRYKAHLSKVVRADFPDAELSGRSDIHCYFWPHAASFLTENGWLGLLTSSAWLDIGYGFALQQWLLRQFAVVAFLESSCEPWFTGARVTTAATILRKESDPEKRARNLIRFVQLRKPLKEILGDFDPDPIRAARCLRDFVEQQSEDISDPRWRIRVVNQHALWLAGCSGECLYGEKSKDPQMGSHLFPGKYQGGKWGIYLRAPDIFFDLLKKCGERLVPLVEIADVRFGLKSGADDFFFVRDVTEDEISKCAEGRAPGHAITARNFVERWGIKLSETNRIRVVESGDGSRHLVESQYIQPLIHSLMEIDHIPIAPEKLGHKAVLVSDSPAKLVGTHVLKYVKWGQRESFDQRETCLGRTSKNRPWYDIRLEPWAGLVLPKIQQYRHIVSVNSTALQVNSSLLEVRPRAGIEIVQLAAILNSTIVAFTKQFYGRVHGREASLQLDVYAANLLPVPDARLLAGEILTQILDAFDSIQRRKLEALDEDIKHGDRRMLDDAVLRLLGFEEVDERTAFLSRLYDEVTALYRANRDVEKDVQGNRRATARQDRSTPRSLAEEIWSDFDTSAIRSFPSDFVAPDEPVDVVTIPEGKAVVVHDLFERGVVKFDGSSLQLGSPIRAEFAAFAAVIQGHGSVSVPKSELACKKAIEQCVAYQDHLKSQLQDLAEERTADPEKQSRIVRELLRMVRASGAV